MLTCRVHVCTRVKYAHVRLLLCFFLLVAVLVCVCVRVRMCV